MEDCYLLQNDIDRFYQWCVTWRLSLNIEKCVYINFTTKRHVTKFDYKIGDRKLEQKSEVKDLGILMSSNLSFKAHIEYIVKKSLQMLGFLKRNCKHFKDFTAIKLLYVTLVRSRLEYCPPIWSPYQSTLSERLERVQRKFLKFLSFKSGRHLSYP